MSTGYTTQHSEVLAPASQGLSPGPILTTQTLSLKSQVIVWVQAGCGFNTEPGKLIKMRK